METKALKQKILNLAVRGALCPQEAADEPASALLARIREEKKEKVKTGELKPSDLKKDSVIFVGEDGLHYEKFFDGEIKCIEGEIPFELPAGWEWERLGNVSTIARGGSPRPIEDFITDAEDGINWIKIGDTEKGGKYICQTKEKIKPAGLSKTRYVRSGAFLLTNSMSFGRPYILKIDGCIHDGWLVIENIETVFTQDYLYYALSSPLMYNMLELLAAGSTVKNLKSDTVRSVLFPIPPLAEQKRIAEKVAVLFACVDEWDEAAESLRRDAAAFTAKTLADAVRGALCPQDPADEPASALLARIREEKKRLAKEGKIKKEKNPAEIIRGTDGRFYEKTNEKQTDITDALPFAIPDSWEWVRLGDIGDWGSGATPSRTNSVYYGGNIPWLKTGDLNDGYIENTSEHITEVAFEESSVRLNPVGSVLIAMYGATIGKLGILKIPATTNQACCACIPYEGIDNRYLFFYLMSQKSAFIRRGEGGAQPNISKQKIVSTWFPVPPLAEQKRIAARVTHILSAIEDLKE